MRHLAITTVAIPLLSTIAAADMTHVFTISSVVNAAEFDGSVVTINVIDMYLASDDEADTLLNIYNLRLPEAAQIDYFQSFTGTGWQPTNLGGPFDTAALREADSFVTIGGFDAAAPEQTPGAGAGTGLDPNFGGNGTPFPGELAGWYNGSPPSLNGQVVDSGFGGLSVLIARFSSTEEQFGFAGTTLEATWNQGLGTPGEQAELMTIPAPGALAMVLIAGIGRSRRRG